MKILFAVPRPGIEPGWIAPLVFETSASTDSAIWACGDKDREKNNGAQLCEPLFFALWSCRLLTHYSEVDSLGGRVALAVVEQGVASVCA